LGISCLKLIGGVPEFLFDFGVGVVGGGGFSPMHEMHQTSQPEEWRKKEVGIPFWVNLAGQHPLSWEGFLDLKNHQS
jgi:hypothetical protein